MRSWNGTFYNVKLEILAYCIALSRRNQPFNMLPGKRLKPSHLNHIPNPNPNRYNLNPSVNTQRLQTNSTSEEQTIQDMMGDPAIMAKIAEQAGLSKEVVKGYILTLTRRSPLATRRSPLVTRHSLLATRYSLLAIPEPKPRP